MTAPTSFGRRQSMPRWEQPVGAPAPQAGLGPEAEAFRASLAADGGGGSELKAWRKSLLKRQLGAWGMGIVLMLPGLISFVVDLPSLLGVGLGIAGFAGNIWLRNERKRRMKDIAGWQATEA